jgi:hypothetical protein
VRTSITEQSGRTEQPKHVNDASYIVLDNSLQRAYYEHEEIFGQSYLV